MTEEILVNVTPRETRVAVVENGMLQELHIERGWAAAWSATSTRARSSG
ncbi:hypothetical protein [Marilutibacter maris]